MARHLLAFGTQHYADGSEELEQVPAELAAVVQLFAGLGYFEQLTELRHDPTSGELQRALELWLRDDARSADDVAVFYYTGHGFTEGGVHYLATTDTLPNSVATAVPSAQLVRLLGPEARLRRLLLILDVCDAGAGLLDAVEFAHRLAPEQRRLAPGEGVWIIAAARPREEARQRAFVTALSKAVAELARRSGPTQEHLALEALMGFVNRRMPDDQRAGYAPSLYATGIAPFVPNRRYNPMAAAGEDLEATAHAPAARALTEHWDPKSAAASTSRARPALSSQAAPLPSKRCSSGWSIRTVQRHAS